MAGMTLEELQNQLFGLSSYTPESEESIRNRLSGLSDALSSARNSYTPESEDSIRQRITSMFDELSSINSPYVPESNESIVQRINELSNNLTTLKNAYVPESVESVRQRVSSIYDPQYQQDLRSLRDSVQLGLNQQQRKAVTTGMQRSSYNSANLAGIRGQGLKAEAALGAQRDTNIATMMNQIIEADKNRQLQYNQSRDSLQMQMNQLQAQLIEAEKDRGINANQYRTDMQMKLNDLLNSIVEADKNRKQSADQYAYNAQLEYDKLLNSLLDNEKTRKLNADANRDNLLLQLYQLSNKGSGGTPKKEETNPLAITDELYKILYGEVPLKVTSVTPDYTEEQRAEYEAVSRAQRNAARKGQSYTGPSVPKADSYNAVVDYNPYSVDRVKNKK